MTAEVLHWQLEDAFPYTGIDDPFLEEHIASIEPRTEAFIEKYQSVFGLGVTAPSLLDFITALETTYHLDHYPTSYLELLAAKNTSYWEKASEVEYQLTEAYRKRDAFFYEILLGMSETHREAVFQSSELDQHREMLLQQYKQALVHDPSKKEELTVIDEEQQKLEDAYSRMYDGMNISLDNEKVDIFSAYGRIQHASNRLDKQHIWENIAACYKANAQEAAILLNGLVKLRIREGTIKSESPLDAQLRGSGFDQQTLQAMIAAAKNYLPDRDVIRSQYAKHYGIDQVERWDMYVPEDSPKEYSLNSVLQALQKSWADLHPDFGAIVTMMIRDGWIDTSSDPESSTQQASFYAPVHGFPRIRFDQSMNSVHTVFHEPGHALYDYAAKKHPLYGGAIISDALNEMIALFSEKISESQMDSMKQERNDTDPNSVLGYRNGLPSTALLNHEFESAVYKRIQNGEMLSADDLAKLYKRTFENWGIRISEGEEWEWVGVPHFFEYSFYYWKYAAGELLANILSDVLAEYEKRGEPQEFGKRLAMFMADGSSKLPHKLFMEYFGVDIHDLDFWQRGFRKAHEYANRLRASR